jgi:hypothetical protein
LQIYVKKTFRDRVWRWPIHAPLVHVPGRRPASRWACYRPLAFTIHSRSRCRMLHYGVGGRTRRQPAVHRTHLHPKWTYPLWPRHLGISRADRPHWTGAPRRPSKPPVTTLRSWLECYGHRPHLQIPGEGCRALGIPDHHHPHSPHLRGCELGRIRPPLPPRDAGGEEPQLVGSQPEAFTGQAKRHPQCPHCLSEDHAAAGCPHNPNPPFVGWFQGTPHLQFGPAASRQPSAVPQKSQEVCRNFNSNRFTRCRYLHVCTDCSGPHAVVNCPNRQPSSGRGALEHSCTPTQPRSSRSNPYPSGANRRSEQQ